MQTTRRDLIKLTALAAAAATLPALSAAQSTPMARAARPLRILILGGTGFTGPFQVNYALARGHKVTLFNRGQKPSPEWPGDVEQLHGDRNTGDLKSLEGREWDVCIDNPTSLPFWVRDAAKVLKGKIGHYLFISTISVYADGSKAGITEEQGVAEYQGKDAMAETLENMRANMELYGPLKALSEAEARKQFGEKVTIVRPGYIVGPRDETDRFTYWPHRIAQGGEVLVPGDGQDPVQVIDGRDLGEWMIRLAEQGTTGTFNAVGPDYTLTTDEMVHGCHAVTGGPITWTHVPVAFLDEQKVDGLPIWVPRSGNEYAGYGQVSNAKAIAAGLTFRPFATTVADLLAWFRALPAERQATLRAGVPREREAELLKAWHARGAACAARAASAPLDHQAAERDAEVPALALAAQGEGDVALGDDLRLGRLLGTGVGLGAGVAAQQFRDVVDAGEFADAVADLRLAERDAAAAGFQGDVHGLAVVAADGAGAAGALVEHRPAVEVEAHLAVDLPRLGGKRQRQRERRERSEVKGSSHDRFRKGGIRGHCHATTGGPYRRTTASLPRWLPWRHSTRHRRPAPRR
jgi:2'-hydroxyisoflavone reductase